MKLKKTTILQLTPDTDNKVELPEARVRLECTDNKTFEMRLGEGEAMDQIGWRLIYLGERIVKENKKY